ncbi:50S ribosomal protein P1 [Candidatus Pacearchaeota archaeon]|nr:50S ribosomal protein P1 [Candidatus Pacearchaeota archaeon]|tara:strand:+ start:212 stop:517 length:306 start_codon:yes stop_codon:yes gene_type:complete
MEYVYGALLLHKLGQTVNEESLKKVISATGAEVDEAKIKTLLAALKDVDIEAELSNASAVASAAPAAGASGGAEGGEAKAEEKEEEEKPAESAAGLASLFG